jgi:hypothetical protein
MSSQDESSRKAKPTRKKNKMAQKKAKKIIKVRDLKPTKDGSNTVKTVFRHPPTPSKTQRRLQSDHIAGEGYRVNLAA